MQVQQYDMLAEMQETRAGSRADAALAATMQSPAYALYRDAHAEMIAISRKYPDATSETDVAPDDLTRYNAADLRSIAAWLQLRDTARANGCSVTIARDLAIKEAEAIAARLILDAAT